MTDRAIIAVVIPAFKVRDKILSVLGGIGSECALVYVVDDACPEASGELVESRCQDPRVRVLRHAENQGVGGATMTGYRAAMGEGADVIVKMDGDGQMDPAFIPRLVRPILDGEADYTKGNRFFEVDGLEAMPWVRLLGNSVLSFASKMSSGYWTLFDPNNGFTALHGAVARELPLEKIARRWFFESDMLFRLGIQRAVVLDVPMPAIYGDEKSNLVVSHVAFGFAHRHLVNAGKRIVYAYYLRSFNFASLQIVLGILSLLFGGILGCIKWAESERTGIPATAGTVMLAALPVLIGVQLLLAFLSYDLQSEPRSVLHRRLGRPARDGEAEGQSSA